MRKEKLVKNEIYHVYNRGVEKRKIFLDEKDYLRFIVNLYEFNCVKPVFNFGRKIEQQPIEVRLQSARDEPQVEILTFCLMPNHYHFMIRQRVENGITEFMRKLGTGYTNYFNLKYQRVGPLFQGKFKAVRLEKEAHFIHLPHYIHLNPLEITMPNWKEGKITDLEGAIDFLKKYRWSSFPDYIGIKNFPTLIEPEFLSSCIGKPGDFLSLAKEWLQNMTLDTIQKVTLESD